MAQLKNLQHEAFCRHMIQAAKLGKSNGWAYQQSGYHCETAAADVAASRLLRTARVQARLAELTAPAVRKTRATIDTLAEQFDAVYAGAMGSAQFGSAGAAAASKAKLLGFMRERIEVGSVGEFEGCETTEDIIARAVETDDPHSLLAFLDEAREALINYLANHAEPIGEEPEPPKRLRDKGAAGEMVRSGMTPAEYFARR